MPISILYQDDYLLVINKPAGVVVNKSKTVKEKTIQDWVEEELKLEKLKLKDVKSDFVKRRGIVHRLDKETSGALLIAKTASSFVSLQKQFFTRQVKKEYLALVHGKMPSREGTIKLPIGRIPRKRRKFAVIPTGRQALSRYYVIETKKYNNQGSSSGTQFFSYLRIVPKTGRTHQIRVHLKHMGNPIVSDPLYLSNKQYKKDKKLCPRMFLHAYCLGFTHPLSGDWLEIKAPISEELIAVLDKLRFEAKV